MRTARVVAGVRRRRNVISERLEAFIANEKNKVGVVEGLIVTAYCLDHVRGSLAAAAGEVDEVRRSLPWCTSEHVRQAWTNIGERMRKVLEGHERFVILTVLKDIMVASGPFERPLPECLRGAWAAIVKREPGESDLLEYGIVMEAARDIVLRDRRSVLGSADVRRILRRFSEAAFWAVHRHDAEDAARAARTQSERTYSFDLSMGVLKDMSTASMSELVATMGQQLALIRKEMMASAAQSSC